MIYQNILTEISPYQARVSQLDGFSEHRHGDIELHFSVKGSFEVIIDKKRHTVNEGELILISPMVAHAFPHHRDKTRKILTLIVGVSFLKNFFSYFSYAPSKTYTLTSNETNSELFRILSETARLCGENRDSKNDLLIRGNLYKICAYLLDTVEMSCDTPRVQSKEMTKVSNIEKALEMIHYEYSKPLTVDDAATATGYGKSNFCKIFKSITGDTFHNVLNRKRVENACNLLCQTNMSVSEIASQVGFLETKTFCRVFKSVTSKTPSGYRNENK